MKRALRDAGLAGDNWSKVSLNLPENLMYASPDTIAYTIEHEKLTTQFVQQYIDLVRTARNLYKENAILLDSCREMGEKIGRVKEILQNTETKDQ